MLRTNTSRLLAVLIALSAALAALAAAGWISLAVNYDALRRLNEDRFVPLTQLKVVSDMYAVNIVDTAHKVRNGGLDWDAGLTALTQAQQEIASRWDAIARRTPMAAKAELVRETRRRMDSADNAVARLKVLIAGRDRAGLDAFVANDLYPAIDPVTENVRDLVDDQLHAAAEDFLTAQSVFVTDIRIQSALTALGLMTIGLGIGIAIFGVSRPMAALSSVMARLSAGDLDVDIPFVGRKDEMGEMARALEVFRSAGRLNRDLQTETARHERWFRRVLDLLPVGVTILDDDGRVTMRNSAMNRIHACPDPDRLIGMTLGELLQEVFGSAVPPERSATPADAAILIQDIEARYRAAPEGRFEVKFPSGADIDMHFRWIGDQALVVVHTDVSSLRRAERRLRDVIAALPISFALFASDRTLVLFNDEFRREFRLIADTIRPGCSAAELVDAYLAASSQAPPSVDPIAWVRGRDDPQQKAKNLHTATEGFLQSTPVSVDIEREYGTYRLRRVTLPDGELVRIAADITDLRQKEAEIRRLGTSALAERTAILQDFIDTIPEAIAVLDQDLRVRFTNVSLADLIGGAAAAAERWTLDQLLAATKIPHAVGAALRRNESREVETTGLDNTPLRIRTTPVSTGDTLIAISDLSDQRRAESERLEQQQRVLQAEKSQAIVTFAGSIAHDFNNLLAVILGFSSLASDGARALLEDSRLPAAAANTLSDISTSIAKVVISAERGRSVVATLSALTKERQAAVKTLDLRAVVKDTEQLLRVLLPASVRLDLSLPRAACAISANATQIEQIITNLCINAMHALEGKAGRVAIAVDTIQLDGGRSESLRVTEAAVHRQGAHLELSADESSSIYIGVLSKGPHVRLRVIDNGQGMTEDVARNIFKPFFTTKAPGKGTGLGLSSVVELVTAHHGGIHVRSRPLTGTVFMVLFPIAADGAPEPERKSLSGDPGTAPDDMRTETRILVIDDEAGLAELGEKILRRAGYETESFTDPISALERFRGDPDAFDMIVTDQTMPRMTGLELTEQALSIRPGIPIIICTGHRPDVERQGAPAPGVKGILRKPYTPLELAKLVRDTLAV